MSRARFFLIRISGTVSGMITNADTLRPAQRMAVRREVLLVTVQEESCRLFDHCSRGVGPTLLVKGRAATSCHCRPFLNCDDLDQAPLLCTFFGVWRKLEEIARRKRDFNELRVALCNPPS